MVPASWLGVLWSAGGHLGVVVVLFPLSSLRDSVLRIYGLKTSSIQLQNGKKLFMFLLLTMPNQRLFSTGQHLG